MARSNRLARETLDRRLEEFRRTVDVPRPHRGWIRAIRDALGMSGPELANRMSIRAQSVYDIEQSEINDSIRIGTLRRAADALDCDLVYALVPRESLDEVVHRRALKKAADHIAPIAHHSRLENQALSMTASRSEVDDLAAGLIDKRGLWSEDAGR